ncbi:hypothetical protein Ltuc_1971 [Legionella tucsonensis]|uniref:Uncharacterized protein n=1 Tax=Legionella tucsonensis TaxID=40335 RepID=A0A0W0ZYE4_9GAMM|nr:hypothetical protein Ltuc_1971 [Legionella tucsonensis]
MLYQSSIQQSCQVKKISGRNKCRNCLEVKFKAVAAFIAQIELKINHIQDNFRSKARVGKFIDISYHLSVVDML